MTVLSLTFSASAFRSAASVFKSSAEKLSSKIKIFGSFATALAMARRCFCPPETLLPPCAISLSYFFSFASINSVACAISAAFPICASDASSFPKRRFDAIVPENRIPFCGTNPISSRRSAIRMSRISFPSKVILPSVTSYRRGIRFTKVDFPHPVLPIIAVVFPGSAIKSISCKTSASAPGYRKFTWENFTTPLCEVICSGSAASRMEDSV